MTNFFYNRIFLAVAIIVMGINFGFSNESKPNIIIIYADDLGYGDAQCYNSERGKILTPHIDNLAQQGMRFVDAHSSSAVCTPSRYTLLTGRYHWRSRLQRGVLGGMSLPLIAPDRLTVAGFLKKHGYATACIGKWHLGMVMPEPITTGTIHEGPTTRGFDYFFGISASLDMAPFAFIENDHFTESPTAIKTLLMVNDKPRRGPAAPEFESVKVLPMLAKKSLEWISTNKDQPFFLYLALNSPHTPIAPSKEWKGKSGLGDYADFVMQTDAVVGEVLSAVDNAGLSQRSIIIVTSDNGCAPYIGINSNSDPCYSHDRIGAVADLEGKGHYPSGPLRGYKSDVWEGGHRIPFIVRWPGVIKSGTTCFQLVHQADIISTVADILGITLPEDAGEDSFSMLPLMKGSTYPVRENAVSTSISGIPGLRQGSWKLIFDPGSGGWSPGESDNKLQLYDLANDIGETNNLVRENPDIVIEMKALIEELITDGRSTPGNKQNNDVEVVRYH